MCVCFLFASLSLFFVCTLLSEHPDSCIRQRLIKPALPEHTSGTSLRRLIKISFELLNLADSSKVGVSSRQAEGGGIKGREVEKCPGQKSGATGDAGDVGDVRDKGNREAAGAVCCLV